MSISILDMSMSLDGYIADTHDYLGGEDGERLHKWADVNREPIGPNLSGRSKPSGGRPVQFLRDVGPPN